MKNTIDDAYKGMKEYGLITEDEGDAGATDAGMEDPPVQVASLVRVLVPLPSTGKPKMPRELCGNRYLTEAEVKRIKDWGRKGAHYPDK